LYPLKAAATKACPNKTVNHYVLNGTHPKRILSDNGNKFATQIWKNKLADMNIDVMFSPIRHPQSKLSERCMTKISKLCRIYCNEEHAK
jgi:hypothetical protein